MDGLSHEVLLFEEMLDGYKQAEQQHEMTLVRLAESERTLSAARYELKQSQDQLRYHTAQTMMLKAKVTEQETTVSNMVCHYFLLCGHLGHPIMSSDPSCKAA